MSARRDGRLGTATPNLARRPEDIHAGDDVALIDLLDRLLGGGVMLAGDITLAVADIDLVYVGLRALVSSVATAEDAGVRLP